jgi:L-cystine transport system permease protein
VSVIRGTPLLLQLFIIYYGLPSLGVTIDPFPSAIIAFTLNVGGYASEVVRAAILAVPRGQWEAAATVGMGYPATLRRIVLPQATRVAVPPLSNTLIALVKDTSLASTIQVTELLRKGQEAGGADVRVLRAVRRRGGLLLGHLPGAVVHAVAAGDAARPVRRGVTGPG